MDCTQDELDDIQWVKQHKLSKNLELLESTLLHHNDDLERINAESRTIIPAEQWDVADSDEGWLGGG